ncbi:DUF3427 domain-containing protein [Paenibacillus illinoisensis]|uniref:DUF3427 domain-containing protein n=1 Tax=Paenibacillus illinoisensis TaxID=59845 RepID=UPI003CEAD233
MPIPNNILMEHVIKAIDYINKHNVPDKRFSTKYVLVHNDKYYPPKYVLSIANTFANGIELEPYEFSGGGEANKFLKRLGFIIIEEGSDFIYNVDKSKTFTFIVGEYYTRKDVYRIVNVPDDKQGGNWDTGYTRYNNDSYVFANVGTAGRTGHDHPNRFDGNDLEWFGKKGSKLSHDSMQSLIYPRGKVYIFAREDSYDTQFVYIGNGSVKSFEDTSPVRIVWQFNDPAENHPEILSEEESEPDKLFEGALKQVFVNVYERNPIARKKCIDHHGCLCSVCNFNFNDYYGELGKDFIHVHHLKPLHEISREYEVDAIEDLRPVCPNCHAMLHKRKPAFSIEELKMVIGDKRRCIPNFD